MHATRCNSGVMGMSKRKDDNGFSKKFIFDKIDIPLVIAVLCFAVIAIVALARDWPFPNYAPRTAEEFSVVIRNYALVLAGVVGFVIAIWRLGQTDKQIEIAANDETRKDKEHVASLFQGAVEMLNGEDMRLVPLGFTQLTEIARDHPEDYLAQTIKLLCVSARGFQRRENAGETLDVGFSVRELVQEAITMEEDFQSRYSRCGPLDLKQLVVQGTTFRNIKLEGSIFGDAHFRNSKFFNCTLSSLFQSTTIFADSFFVGCDLRRGMFFGTDFESTRIYQSVIGSDGISFIDCSFENSEICSVYFTSDTETPFRRCNLGDVKFLDEPSPYVGYIASEVDLPEFDGVVAGFTPQMFSECYIVEGSVPPKSIETIATPLKLTTKRDPEKPRQYLLEFSTPDAEEE